MIIIITILLLLLLLFDIIIVIIIIIIIIITIIISGGHSSVVRVSEFKSEDPGFYPLLGQCCFFIPPSQLLGRLVRVYGMRPNVCAR